VPIVVIVAIALLPGLSPQVATASPQQGQAMAPELGYAPLPPAIVTLATEALGKIKT